MCLSSAQLQINNSINKCDIKWCDRKVTPYFPTGGAFRDKPKKKNAFVYNKINKRGEFLSVPLLCLCLIFLVSL